MSTTPKKRLLDYAPALLFALVGYLYVQDDQRRDEEHNEFMRSIEQVIEKMEEMDNRIDKHDTAIAILQDHEQDQG